MDCRGRIKPGRFGAEIAPRVYLVGWYGMCERALHCNVYALQGDDGVLLVDSGPAWGVERMSENLAHWGIGLCDVGTALLTHYHVDHAAGGCLFKAHGTKILCHQEAASLVENQWEAQQYFDVNGAAWRVDGVLSEGRPRRRCGLAIEVFHTPGHTRGCLTYRIAIDGAEFLFSGDLVMSDGQPGWIGDSQHDRSAIVASLRRMTTVSFDHLCHGHEVLMNDRGALFHHALAREARGDWDAPGGCYAGEPVPGRKPACLS